MKKFLAAALLPLGTALTVAAPAQADTAVSTINQLQSKGYTVSISRFGNGPMEQCTVVSVRTSRPSNQFSLAAAGDDANVFTSAGKPKATVSLNCSD